MPLSLISPEVGGGKASGLARLARLGLSVPDALVIIGADAGTIPEGITEAWEALGGGAAAVRSSGSDEDGEGASAAGQFDTFLNVPPDALEDAVLKCIESAASERVNTYEHAISGVKDSSMSVVIQKMVRPSRAGVIFTADPLSGNRDVMVVESVAGLGEELVSGRAEAAGYVLIHPSAAGHNPDGLIRECSGDLANAGLSEVILEELRSGAVLAAEDWGMPLDLEWAVDSDSGELKWLQARPITALADSLDSIVGADELITRSNIGEMMPGAVTPLTFSTFGRSLSTGLAQYFRSFGALKRREPEPVFINCFDGQLFMNLSSMYIMTRRVLGATAEGTELGILGYVPTAP